MDHWNVTTTLLSITMATAAAAVAANAGKKFVLSAYLVRFISCCIDHIHLTSLIFF